ncbi:MAG: DUF1292 domain-containing protein [Clostridium sp.]|uniref:DUF1292 domain-containing protein n=1 Tax=Clostridium sp. TaxID=1506 RepID=UPI002A87A823|nr:DUF1292 domain-containing protein [Clostridium sp.]MDY5098411.1 DUF1292 domain-containing protein [Clostridium sp.]
MINEDMEVMYFKDEEGNKVAFEPIAEIYLDEETENEKQYLILSPVEGNNSEEDAYIFRVDMVDGNKELNFVEDDEEFLRVSKEYKNLLYNK